MMLERVRAILIRGGMIALVKRTKKEGTYWAFPGGEVDAGENHEQALARECLEELGLTVSVGKLFTKRPSTKPGAEGHMEFFYLCDVLAGTLGTGTGPETHRNEAAYGIYEFLWVPLPEIKNLDLKPNEMRDMVVEKMVKL